MNPLEIGQIIGVSAEVTKVLITTPDSEIAHQGHRYRVGQLGAYVIAELADERLVGCVTAMHREDVPGKEGQSRIVLEVQLLGRIGDGRFSRGINQSPIVGDPVCLAVQEDFELIFGSFAEAITDGDETRALKIGRFASNTDFPVLVSGSEFLGKHLAILGNSGSGKSCSTAKILGEIIRLPDAQVVLFDLHGEYRTAFSDPAGNILPNVTYLSADELVLPYWLLNYHELELLLVDKSNPLLASPQVSFLRSALLEFKRDAARELNIARELTMDTPIFFSLDRLKWYAENLNEARFVLNSEQFAFTSLALRSLLPAEQQQLMRRQRCAFNKGNPEGETQHPVYFGKLMGLIDKIETRMLDRRYHFLLKPVEHARESALFREHLAGGDTAERMSAVMSHLIRIFTGQVTPRTNLTILDMSGLPFDIIDITVSVITRLLFDLNFWTPAAKRRPVLLVYEEAHNYIPRQGDGRSFASLAVERVAKEGRKYGVGAVIVSQRPRELSETVLSQCGNMVAMRINNPEDQDYVARLVSDNFGSLVSALPMLRPGEAFIIGDSVPMPLRTLIDLPECLPSSSDVDFMKCWSAPGSDHNLDSIVEHWWRQDRRRHHDGPPDEAIEPTSPPPAPRVPVPGRGDGVILPPARPTRPPPTWITRP